MKILEFFKKKKTKEEDLQEFSFIWYKKVETNNKTHYTSPFRTKIKAKTYEEAKIKLVDFTMSKTKLVIMDEDEFSKSKMNSFEFSMREDFDKINKAMDKFFSDIKFK